METDCAFAFKEIIGNLKGIVQRDLVLRIRELVSRGWNVVFKKIPREVKSIAHLLASMMKASLFNIQTFHTAPL